MMEPFTDFTDQECRLVAAASNYLWTTCDDVVVEVVTVDDQGHDVYGLTCQRQPDSPTAITGYLVAAINTGNNLSITVAEKADYFAAQPDAESIFRAAIDRGHALRSERPAATVMHFATATNEPV